MGVKSQNTGQEREKSVKQRVRGEMRHRKVQRVTGRGREGGRERERERGIKEIERK